ncbi:hypothetical protein [Polyangium mundeleinium]|uniref:HEAT repeat domain-containing protein n=1 Tax=Polyangium mundeleinium TaxID=2995306 RepID=A0ABT5ET31_9BACT|nr:hypothetical protein [Polyangium mundeleinium]MDC0744524.1 hypothetical protein [Polyangium mundeleinium]
MPLPNVLLHFNWKELQPGPVRDAFDRLFADDVADEERVRIARKILAQDIVTAHCMLFDVYQRMAMDSRWGASNLLDELVGPMRVKAMAILRRPDDHDGRKHAAAAQIVARTAKPKDIPLLLERLDHPTHPELPMWMYWALRHVVEDLRATDTTLIAAMGKRLVPGRDRVTCNERVEASRLLGVYRVQPAEEALLRALEKLAPDEAIPVATALLWHDPVRHLHAARRIRDALPKGFPRDEDHENGMGYPFTELRIAIEESEEEGALALEIRAQIAAMRRDLATDPRAALAKILPDLDRDTCYELTPTLCQLLASANEALARDVLRALGRGAAPTYTLFHTIEPWLHHEDLELRGLAMGAALNSPSDQARARLLARFRRACVSDAADACTMLRALAATNQLYLLDRALTASSPLPEVRQTAATLLAEEARRRAAEEDHHEPGARPPPSRTRSPNHDG